MKTILIFIGLKLLEILGICGIIVIAYYIGQYYLYLGLADDGAPFMPAFLGLVSMFVSFVIGMGIYAGIIANWEWASKLSRK